MLTNSFFENWDLNWGRFYDPPSIIIVKLFTVLHKTSYSPSYWVSDTMSHD